MFVPNVFLIIIISQIPLVAFLVLSALPIVANATALKHAQNASLPSTISMPPHLNA